MKPGLSYAKIQARLNWFKLAKERNVSYACLYFGVSRKTFYKWKRRYERADSSIEGLMDVSRRPKRSPGKTPPHIEALVLKLRGELECGPRLLSFYLKRDHMITLSPFGVYKVLKRHNEVRVYRKKKRFKKRYTSVFIKSPGQKVQVDVKYCPRIKGVLKLYQYTAIDCFSRLRLAYIYPEVSPSSSVDFLKRCVAFFPFKIHSIQTDHGSEFTYAMFPEFKVKHPLDVACGFYKIKHKLIPIATPHHNGVVENSHGKDDVECYGPSVLRNRLDVVSLIRKRNETWNLKRPHQALGLRTPLEWLNLTPGYERACLNFEGAYSFKEVYSELPDVTIADSRNWQVSKK